MGLFDMFNGNKKLEKMLDEVLKATEKMFSKMDSKKELIDYLENNKIGGRITPSLLTWQCVIANEPWEFFVSLENGELTDKKMLNGKELLFMGNEEYSKFGGLSFSMSKDSLIFKIKPPLIDMPVPSKGLKLASIINNRGYMITVMEKRSNGFKRICID